MDTPIFNQVGWLLDLYIHQSTSALFAAHQELEAWPI